MDSNYKDEIPKRISPDKRLKLGKQYQQKFGKKKGVVTLESGLQYEILINSDGKKPDINDHIFCHYHGTTIDGVVFDSSVERKKPETFALSQLIEGWRQALLLMNTGSKWKLVIPPHLAYGKQGVSKEIGSNSTLVFEVELLGIK